MLPVNFLTNNADEITSLYERLQTSIMVDIATHIKDAITATGRARVSATAQFQIERLRHAGLLRKDIVRNVAKTALISERELRDLMHEARITMERADLSVYRAAGYNPIPIYQSESMLRIFEAGVRKTLGEIGNLTGSTIVTAQERFQQAVNLAYNKVASGAMTHSEAIGAAVDELAAQGVSALRTASGKGISLEAGVRRAVLTGVNQTAGEMTHAALKELDADLCRTSAHIGARNAGEGFANHEQWQGKVFSLKGSTAQHEAFEAACGYGHVQGIYGANCRHSHGIYIEGVSPDAYNDGQLDKWADKTVTYNGEELPYYDATQRLRYIERMIRAYKRRARMKEAAGLDASIERIRVAQWQNRANGFMAQTGLRREFARERIARE